jgi:uncharacterized membrane protein
MMYDDYGWGWWWMGAVAFVVLLILVAGVVAVVFAARPRAGQGDTLTRPVSAPSTTALAELDVRFARGEVDEDTYRRTRDLLTRPPTW